jgi:hypothetical protein
MNMKAMQTTHPLWRELVQRDWIEGWPGEGVLDLHVGTAALAFHLEHEDTCRNDCVCEQEHLQDPERRQRP